MAHNTEPPRLARTFDIVSSTPVGRTRSSGAAPPPRLRPERESARHTAPHAPGRAARPGSTDSTLIRAGARRTFSSIKCLPRASRVPSSTRSSTKCATTPSLPSDVTITSRSPPASAASAATNSIPGVSTTGRSSLGTVFVAGRNRVPRPAAGTIAVYGMTYLRARHRRPLVHIDPRPLTPDAIVLLLVNTAKADLRQQLIAARKNVTRKVRNAEAAALISRLRDLPWERPVGTVCAYVPVGSEPGSVEMLDSLDRIASRVLLPVRDQRGDGTPLPLSLGTISARRTGARPGIGLVEPGGTRLPAAVLAGGSRSDHRAGAGRRPARCEAWAEARASTTGPCRFGIHWHVWWQSSATPNWSTSCPANHTMFG